MAAKNIKIFIASAGEVKVEREKAILLLNDLRKAHKHLDLEAVEWEYDTVPGSQPGFDSVQDAINPKLAESDIAVFIFYSRIGHYTKVEFDLAQQLGKKFFVLFKEGFSPSNELEGEAYKSLEQFKNRLNSTTLYQHYAHEEGFYHTLYRNLNVYLSEAFPNTAMSFYSNITLPAEVSILIKLLNEKEDKIKALEDTSDNVAAVQKLHIEIANIKRQLAQSEQLRQQDAADKTALELQLKGQKVKDALKAQALEAVEKGDYNNAEDLLKESAKENVADTASTFFELGKVKKLQLKYREAFEYYGLAAKIAPENPQYLNEAGLAANQLGYTEKALANFEKSLKLAIDQYGKDHVKVADCYNNLGTTYKYKGIYHKAIECFALALEIDKKVYGETHLNTAILLDNLGAVYSLNGEFDEAKENCENALAIFKQIHGEEHRDLAYCYDNLGEIHNHLGLCEDAIHFCKKALDIQIKFCGEIHPDVATCYGSLGLAYLHNKNWDESLNCSRNALAINKEIFGEQHPRIAICFDNLGLAYRYKTQFSYALKSMQSALSIFKECHGEEHPDTATCYNNLGLLYTDMGEFDDAIVAHQKCLSILQKLLHNTHPHIIGSKKSLQIAINAKNRQLQ